MNKQSEEDYLDGLLNSVNQEERHREMVSVDREFLKELQMAKSGQDVWKYGANRFRLGEGLSAAKAEAEFLKEFEKELEEDEFEDFLKGLGEDMENLSLEELALKLRSDDEADTVDSAEIQSDAGRTDSDRTDADKSAMTEFGMSKFEMDEPDLSIGSDMDMPSEDTIDLAELGEEDLISLLAGTEDLADIGALLSKNDSEQPIEAEDAFAAFAASEMLVQTEAVEDKTADSKKKNAKKGGFLEKLSTLLFGKDSAEGGDVDTISLSGSNAPDIEFLSDENAQILAAFAEADELEVIGKSGKAGGKGKKDKKKEAKEKKPAKPKTPKKPKEKKPKEKKPKEKDNTPPLPKGPVVLVCILAVSIFVLVYFGTELIGYQSAVSEAKTFYKLGMYTEAANKMSGLQVKDTDTLIHNKITTLAAVDSKLSAYKVFIKHDKKAEAIDALVSAAGRCEVNSKNAEIFACTEELSILKDEVTALLNEQFNMTYEEAVELYQLTEDDRTEYTIALNEVMEKLGIK